MISFTVKINLNLDAIEPDDYFSTFSMYKYGSSFLNSFKDCNYYVTDVNRMLPYFFSKNLLYIILLYRSNLISFLFDYVIEFYLSFEFSSLYTNFDS